MFSLLAIAGVFLGFLALPASPVLGFLAIGAGLVSAGRAMARPNDLPAAAGAAMLVCVGYGGWQLLAFTARALARP